MTPSRLATWLMERFGTQESVVGDLIERARVKSSRTWYWRQALTAIVRATWRDLSDRRLASLSAVMVGWGMLLAAFGLSSLFAPPESLNFWTVWLNVGPAEVTPWTPWWESMRNPGVAGLWCVGCLSSGWMAARFRPTALLAFAITVSVWGLSSATVVLGNPAWHGLRWFAPYRDMTTFVSLSVTYVVLVAVLMPFLVLTGGLVSISPQTTQAAER